MMTDKSSAPVPLSLSALSGLLPRNVRNLTVEDVPLRRPPAPQDILRIIDKNKKLLLVIYRCLTGANTRVDLIDIVISSCRRALRRNLIYLASHLAAGPDRNWCLNLLKEPQESDRSPVGQEGCPGIACQGKFCNDETGASWATVTANATASKLDSFIFPAPLPGAGAGFGTCSGSKIDLNKKQDMISCDMNEMVEGSGSSASEYLLPEFLFYVTRICNSELFTPSSLPMDLAMSGDKKREDLRDRSSSEFGSWSSLDDGAGAGTLMDLSKSTVPRNTEQLPSNVSSLLEVVSGRSQAFPPSLSHPQNENPFNPPCLLLPVQVPLLFQFDMDENRHLCFCSTKLEDVVWKSRH